MTSDGTDGFQHAEVERYSHNRRRYCLGRDSQGIAQILASHDKEISHAWVLLDIHVWFWCQPPFDISTLPAQVGFSHTRVASHHAGTERGTLVIVHSLERPPNHFLTS